MNKKQMDNDEPHSRSHWFWPALVVAMLVLQLFLCAGTVYFATTGHSDAIEPTYYDRAINWDENSKPPAQSK